jgi:hypothetical protein
MNPVTAEIILCVLVTFSLIFKEKKSIIIEADSSTKNILRLLRMQKKIIIDKQKIDLLEIFLFRNDRIIKMHTAATHSGESEWDMM